MVKFQSVGGHVFPGGGLPKFLLACSPSSFSPSVRQKIESARMGENVLLHVELDSREVLVMVSRSFLY